MPATLLLLAAAVCAPTPVRAAESYDNCTGFINSLPTVISTQGVWCLNKNLSTAITSGSAITIATNNVTIDCNDFKIGGLAAGDSSSARGIYAFNRQNATVRHCAIRGFNQGIDLYGGAGHLVEDNRLDNNLVVGIAVHGANNRIRRNAIYDTGGYPSATFTYGIIAEADAVDNTVSGVYGTDTNTYPRGIYVAGAGNEARGNRVRGLVFAGTGYATGVYVTSAGIRLADNWISAATLTDGYGIYGPGANTSCTDNTVINLATAYSGCDASVDNVSLP